MLETVQLSHDSEKVAHRVVIDRHEIRQLSAFALALSRATEQRVVRVGGLAERFARERIFYPVIQEEERVRPRAAVLLARKFAHALERVGRVPREIVKM